LGPPSRRFGRELLSGNIANQPLSPESVTSNFSPKKQREISKPEESVEMADNSSSDSLSSMEITSEELGLERTISQLADMELSETINTVSNQEKKRGQVSSPVLHRPNADAGTTITVSIL
jgi:hypothetical protein